MSAREIVLGLVLGSLLLASSLVVKGVRGSKSNNEDDDESN